MVTNVFITMGIHVIFAVYYDHETGDMKTMDA